MTIYKAWEDQSIPIIVSNSPCDQLRGLATLLTAPNNVAALDKEGSFLGIACRVCIDPWIAVERQRPSSKKEFVSGDFYQGETLSNAGRKRAATDLSGPPL